MKTTDPQHEWFDLYNTDGEPLGLSKPRGEVHRDGDWHRSLHLWVWGISGNEDPFVIFQRRSMTKDTWAGALDVAVGGHFRSGESLAETLREAEEEIGLIVSEDEIVRLGRRFHDWKEPAFHDCEINEVYAVRCDQPLTTYRQHPDEIDELARMRVADGIEFFNQRIPAVDVLFCGRGTDEVNAKRVTSGDFVDTSDDYASVTLESIQQLARGRTPELFVIRGATALDV